MQMTQKEERLLKLLEGKGYRIDHTTITRGRHEEISDMGGAMTFVSSDREFELSFSGIKMLPRMGTLAERSFAFHANLILACIRELVPWTSRKVAMMSDYPEMVLSGDWSGMRDSSPETLQEIFNQFVLPLVK